jgi:hypothetical protein
VTAPHRGFRDAELHAVAERVGALALDDRRPHSISGEPEPVHAYDVMTAAEFGHLLYLVRAALDEVRATPSPPAARPFPADWWIASAGLDETVWRPGKDHRYPTVVAMRYETDAALWDLLKAALPDRRDCVVCTATPCPTHAPDQAGAR